MIIKAVDADVYAVNTDNIRTWRVNNNMVQGDNHATGATNWVDISGPYGNAAAATTAMRELLALMNAADSRVNASLPPQLDPGVA